MTPAIRRRERLGVTLTVTGLSVALLGAHAVDVATLLPLFLGGVATAAAGLAVYQRAQADELRARAVFFAAHRKDVTL